MFPVHTPLAQSVAAMHNCLFGHFGHTPPPQSLSVSFPFLTLSMQLAATIEIVN